MAGAIDVVVPGRPSCDVIFSGLTTWPAAGREIYATGLDVYAGAHFNTAAALARLGLRVALVAVVGDDEWGKIVLRDVRAEGLPERFVRVLPGVPTPLSVALNHAGDRGFVTYGPGHEHAVEEILALTREVLASHRVRHVHGDLSASRELVEAVRAAGATLSVDAFDAGDAGAPPAVRVTAAAADIVFANEDEARAATGAADWRDALDELATWSRHVVVKRGRAGAVAVADGEYYEATTVPVEAVDATGAGDCFAAAYLLGFLAGLGPRECLVLGNVAGRAAVSARGGFTAAPRREELAAAARRAGIAGVG